MASAAVGRDDPRFVRVVFRIKKTCYEPASEELRLVASPTKGIRDWDIAETVNTLYSGLNEFFVEVGAPKYETMWYKLFVLRVTKGQRRVVHEEEFERELRLEDKPVLVEILYNDRKALVTEIDRRPKDISVRTPPITTSEPIEFITDEPQPAGWELGPDTITIDEFHTAEYYAVGGEMNCRVISPPKNKKPDFHAHEHTHGKIVASAKPKDEEKAESGDAGKQNESIAQEAVVNDKSTKKKPKNEKRDALKSNAGAEAARQIVHVPVKSDTVVPKKLPSKFVPVNKKGADVNRTTCAQSGDSVKVAQQKVTVVQKKVPATKERVSHDDMMQVDSIRAQTSREVKAIQDFFKNKKGEANDLDIGVVKGKEGSTCVYQLAASQRDTQSMMRACEVIGDSVSNVPNPETKSRARFDDIPVFPQMDLKSKRRDLDTASIFEQPSSKADDKESEPKASSASTKETGFMNVIKTSSTTITKQARNAENIAKSLKSKVDNDTELQDRKKKTAKSVFPLGGTKYAIVGAVGGTIGAVAAYMWVTRHQA